MPPAIIAGGIVSFSFFGWVGFADGDVGVAAFFLEATAEVIVAAVHGAGTAFAGHEVVAVRGFDFFAADVAADRVFNNHCLSSLSNSFIRCAPYCTPSRKALCS